ncbi:phospholipase D-like domain-containing protein [Sphingosinicella sp. LHD-64]|uniref:phospholipase D-like domain-containing protein n=1 Tax=Sphingosinicella sp. LHD-64 TaxID=3072139 RepID=UPI00280D39B1|nr:phospholipase D-like domain-containing protein [Sphingosinicella sp. LHD-64]MDQ8758168.1 phospholipase D-like domain-containing protein [Sphingosinicella sp. LHD-64]
MTGDPLWRVEQADRAALIVDAADYFNHARSAMLQAQRRIMLIGWDFDARLRIGDADAAEPATIGEFILWLADRRPDLDIYLLRWDVGAFKSVFRGITPITLLRWMWHKRIHVRLDGAHPTGASHHQKIVVIDDCLAFCGGIDMTVGRWDTRTHRDDDPRRVGPGAKPYDPWHDATMALAGPIAAALGELARDRWVRSGGRELGPVRTTGPCWPEELDPQFEQIPVGIARTSPSYRDFGEVIEIEALYLALIARARRFIYAETQYFASRRIAEAMARRLAEIDGPEIVIINPEQADGWLEQTAMDNARARLFEAVRRVDTQGRFRIFHPFTAAGTPIYVHAKLMVVDDLVLRCGSSNMNNRSLRFDTECDVIIDAEAAGEVVRERIAAIRTDLMAEHLGVDPKEVSARFIETGSLIETIEGLVGAGKTLRPYQVPDLSAVEAYLADHEVLDPEEPDEMFEPIGRRRGLFRRLHRPRLPK